MEDQPSESARHRTQQRSALLSDLTDASLVSADVPNEKVSDGEPSDGAQEPSDGAQADTKPKPASSRQTIVRKYTPTPWEQLQKREAEITRKRRLQEMQGVEPAVRSLIIANRKRSAETKEATRVAPKTSSSSSALTPDTDTKSSTAPNVTTPWNIAKTAATKPVQFLDRPAFLNGTKNINAKVSTKPNAKITSSKPVESKPNGNIGASKSEDVPTKPKDPVPTKHIDPSPTTALEKKSTSSQGTGFRARATDRSLTHLLDKNSKWRGQKIHNPSPNDMPPPVTTRTEALSRHGEDAELPIGVSQITELLDELWLFGITDSCATVALELTGFCPFFFINAPRGNTAKDAQQLLNKLNEESYWPSDYSRRSKRRGNKGRGRKSQVKDPDGDGDGEAKKTADDDLEEVVERKNPIVNVEIEPRLNGVVYKGRHKLPVFRIDFASMTAFRHYRQKLAKQEISLGWRVQLFHEEHGLTQMFFNRVNIALFSYVSVEAKVCQFLPESAWTELERLQEMDDELRSASASQALGDSGAADYFEDELIETTDVGPALETLPRTTALLEGSLHYSSLKPLKVEATPPIEVAVFDIETISFEAAEHQRAHGKPPPLPPAAEDEYAPKRIGSKDQKGDAKAIKAPVDERDALPPRKVDAKSKATEEEFAGRFPVSNKPRDAAAIISTQFMIVGDNEAFLKVLHVLGKPQFEEGDLPDTVVFSFDLEHEKEMLEHWATMLRSRDIEVLAGYNSISYDGAYLAQRARVLRSNKALRAFSRFNTLPTERIKKAYRYKECTPSARRGGSGMNADMPQQTMPAIIQLDALKIIKQLEKMDSYSLKEVAAVLLGGTISKFDMPYSWISPYWGAGGGYLRRLAIYCEQDVNVTLNVMIKRFLIGHAIEIARATYTSISDQMLKGQQIRTWNLLVRYAHYNGWLLDEQSRQDAQEAFGVQVDRLPRYLRKYIPKDEGGASERESASIAKIKYAGATVLVPITGFYTSLVCTADFASLYPSIIVSHLLCFSTWTEHRYGPDGTIWFPHHDRSHTERNLNAYKTWNVEMEARPTDEELNGRDLIMVVIDRINDITTCFTINRGAMLPSILVDLLALRKRVKKELEVAEENHDKFLAAVLDARQAAIKVTCNAAYGFCGAIIGFFGFVSIASTTCTIGRFKIEQTKRVFEEEEGGKVIYGDTDSVFAIFPKLEAQTGKTKEEIQEEVKALAAHGCKLVSSRLPAPMKLEFEKAMTPFLMIIKKQYCGQWIYPKPKTFFKGTANVRRDSCDLARKVIGDTLKQVLKTPDRHDLILLPLKEALKKMVDPNLDLNLLVRTVGKQAIKKTEELQQIKLIQKIEKRRGAPLDIGTRVRMIITLPNGGTRVRTKDDGFLHDAEEVQYAIDHGIKPDRAYYCERQLREPLIRYIGTIIPPPQIEALVNEALAKIYVLQSNLHTVTDFFAPISADAAPLLQPALPPS